LGKNDTKETLTLIPPFAFRELGRVLDKEEFHALLFVRE
jgi:hypothetical protein